MCEHLRVSRQSICQHCNSVIDNNSLKYAYRLTQNIYIKYTNYQIKTQLLEQQFINKNLILLFLDLDNTILVAKQPDSSQFTYENAKQLFKTSNSINDYYKSLSAQKEFYLQIDGQELNIAIRPGLFKFLYMVKQQVKIIISTLSVYNYAVQIADIIDPNREIIIDIIAREHHGMKKMVENGARGSKILRKRSIIFDDQSLPWCNKLFSAAFLKSIPYRSFNSQCFIPLQSHIEFSCIQLSSFQEQIFQDQLFSLVNIITFIRQNIQQLHSTELFFKQYRQSIFKNCTFYVPINKDKYFIQYNGEYILSASYNDRPDLLIHSIILHGGRVTATLSNKEITHLVYTQNLIEFLREKYGIKQQQQVYFQDKSLLFNGIDTVNSYNFCAVDIDYIFKSCYLFAKQDEAFSYSQFLSFNPVQKKSSDETLFNTTSG